jgi:hypothetical protein
VILRLDVRRTDDIGAARIDNDQLGALAQPLLETRGEHRVPVGRVCADDHDYVGLFDAVEILRAGRRPECRLQSIASRRVTNTRAGIDIVVAETGANQFLDEEGFLVGAA